MGLYSTERKGNWEAKRTRKRARIVLYSRVWITRDLSTLDISFPPVVNVERLC
jgi:hypothetical protein